MEDAICSTSQTSNLSGTRFSLALVSDGGSQQFEAVGFELCGASKNLEQGLQFDKKLIQY